MTKEKQVSDTTYSLTLYKTAAGLPSMNVIERTGTSGLYWPPRITRRMLESSEIIYVMGGYGKIAVDDRWIDAQPHDVFFIPPHVPLDLVTQEQNKLDLLYAHFHMRSHHNYLRLAGSPAKVFREIESLTEQEYMEMLAIPDYISLPEDNPVLKALNSSLDIYEEKSHGYLQECATLLLAAIHQLSSTFIREVGQRVVGPRGTTAALARRIRSYLDARITAFTGMKELAKTFDMNAQHLSRVFKKVYGENVVTYMNRLRVNAAKWILVTTDDTMPEVAKGSGFRTTKHFQWVFKKEAGMSPVEFRNSRTLKAPPGKPGSEPFE